MKKKLALLGMSVVFVTSMLGCGKKSDDKETTEVATTETATITDATDTDATTETTEATTEEEIVCELEDGTYIVDFDTDSSMFHVNDSKEGKAILTVEDGKMTVHIVLTSKNVVNLYYGFAEDAQKDGAQLLQPTPEEVTYSDGTTEEVNSFDVPVPYLDEEFDVALIGKKGVWYDHKVSVSNPVKEEAGAIDVEDGTYEIQVTLEGGSGKATVEPTAKIVFTDNKAVATIVWSSKNYDYMLVDGEKYLPINEEGNSTFEIPVASLDTKLEVVGDTVAMSEPHEIEYTLYFDSTTLTKVE